MMFDTMTYDARQIANWFIERATLDGKSLSITSLLKLTYIAHGWYLEARQKPLINNSVKAWSSGPIIEEIYHEFRPQGIYPTQISIDYPALNSEEDIKFLQEIYDIYANMDSFKLSSLTDLYDGPWDITRRIGGDYAEIPNILIRQHYEEKRRQHEDKINSMNKNMV